MAFASHRGDNARYGEELDDLLARKAPTRIWLLMSHVYRDEGPYLVDHLAHLGSIEQNTSLPGAQLVLVAPRAGRR